MHKYRFLMLFLLLNVTFLFQLSLSHTNTSSQNKCSNTSKLTFKKIVFHGSEPYERFGCAPSEVGDVNNDGYDDFVIGQITDGIASLFFGRPSNQWKSNNSRADADVILKTNASACQPSSYRDDWCFTAPAIGGNFNGDSYDDFIIMNSGMHPYSKGGVMVFLGRSSEQWKENSSALNVNTTFVGENDGDRAGHGATGVGDVNNDGFDDLVIGALNNDEGGDEAGQTYLILGSSTFEWNGQYSLSSLANASFIGEASGDLSGIWVNKAGDVNKDGFDDFVIGAFEGQSTDTNRKVHLIFGRPTDQWYKDTPLSQANVTFISEDRSRDVGLSWRWSSGAGDVNNDGFSDFIFGDYRNDKTYLILGRPTEKWRTNYYFSESNSSFLGENGIIWSGFCVTGVGDTNMDGNDDFLIGAFASGGHLGKVYLILGRSSDRWTQNMPLDQSNASFIGETESDWFGWDISGAGDVDNNGLDDLLIGAPENIFDSNRGKAYLFLSEITHTTSTPSIPNTSKRSSTSEQPTTRTNAISYFGVLIALSLPYLFTKRKNN
ncbi:MAG: integrin alpha [Candidatus Hodarchaeota archaeon]